jgi:hypothetical protein
MHCPDVDPPGGSFDGISVLIAFVVFLLVCFDFYFTRFSETRGSGSDISLGPR